MAGLATEASGSSSSSAPGGGFGGSVDTELLSMLFFHAVTLQALLSSFIAGYIREVKLVAGVKFAVILSSIALVVWIAVG
jgi:flagellar protein FlaJ